MKQMTLFVLAASLFVLHCQKAKQEPIVELAAFPITSIDEIITKTNVAIDTVVTADGNGSLLITAPESMTVKLFEIKDPDVENARLVYQAKLKSENLQGQAFLEILVYFYEKGEFFGRGIYTPVSGTTDWINSEAYFYLRKGENPDRIRLNLIIEGKGKVWVDDIHLTKGPLTP